MDLIKSTSKVFIARALNAVVMFIGITYFARELGAQLLGSYFLFEALLAMIALAADFGVKGAVEKRLSEGENPGKVLGSAVFMKTALLLLILLVIVPLGPIIDGYVGLEVVYLLIIASTFNVFAKLGVKILNGEKRVGETAIIELTHRTVWFGLGAILVNYGAGIYGLIYAEITALVLMAVIGAIKCTTSVHLPTFRHTKSLIDYAKYEVITGAGDRLFNWFDILVIGFFLAQNFVGAYEIAWRVAAITILFSMAIRQSIFPVISSLDAEGNTTQIESIVAKSTTYSLYIVIPAIFGVAALSGDILSIVFGPEYQIASLALMILMFHRISYAINVTTGRALQAINHPDEAAYSMVAGLSTNIILNISLVPLFGITGAAIATTVSYIVMLIVRIIYLRKYIHVWFEYRKIGWFIISSAIMMILVRLFAEIINVTSIIELVLVVGVGAAIYFVISLLDQEFRHIVIQFSQKALYR